MHVATWQVTSALTYELHEVGLWPSHRFVVHTLLLSSTGHGGRLPTGVPAIVTQLPSAPAVLHAWHWPVHEDVQHTPSTQYAFPSGVAAQVPGVVHEVPAGTTATTSIVAVIEPPTESARRKESFPTVGPAVYRPAAETEPPEALVTSCHEYGGLPPDAVNGCTLPGASVIPGGAMVRPPPTVTVAVATAKAESRTWTSSTTLGVGPAL
jgi:hypothetical protein